jgi:hypothetical protein|tara:strand:- start:536 stop:733 length:198 start_codon:yes stop_codon:yes gene_type:complete
MMARVKAIVDKRLEKYMSRKLLVWLTTTGLLLADKVTNEQWVAIALAYVGIQGFADIAVRWKSGK